uniref:Uncharacterized protein n=1 Tax=Anguilla anguilla TaxID=7936 RepID=A0A0E9TY55_ANGAN
MQCVMYTGINYRMTDLNVTRGEADTGMIGNWLKYYLFI